MNKRRIFEIIIFVFLVLFILPFFQNLEENLLALFLSNGNPVKLHKLVKYSNLIISFSLIFVLFLMNLKFFKLPSFAFAGPSSDSYSKKFVLLFCLLTSAVVLLFCSQCSFIYPLNFWDDSNCFFTVGKSVLSGRVLYKDLFEQKGPYLYFIHTFSALISYRSFIGVYFFEIIFTTVFLIYAYKILLLFTNKKILFLLPLFLAIIYSSYNFQYGDSAEEFCLPLLIIPFYYSILNIHNETDFTPRQLIVTGICAGFVFYIKFSMTGFFVGFAIMPVVLYAKNKKYKDILLAVLYILAGLVIISIPLIIYCLLTDSFKDFYEVYIYDNIFLYSDENIVQQNIFIKIFYILFHTVQSLFFHFRNNFFVSILALISVFVVFKNFKFKEIINYFLMILFTLLFIFGPGRNYNYYSLILDVFLIFSIIPFFTLSERIENHQVIKITLFTAASILIVWFMPFHKKNRFMAKEDLVQYKYAGIINQKENATLLNYAELDDGFYLTSGIVPSTRYFIVVHVPVKEMQQEQDRIVKAGEVDFIVSRTPVAIAEKYNLIAVENSQRVNWEDTEFYLYQKK